MKKHWLLILGLIVGILAGGLLSELFELVAPTSMVKTFLTKGVEWGIQPPVTLDLGAITLTLGFTIDFTIFSLLCVIFIVYYFRWWIGSK